MSTSGVIGRIVAVSPEIAIWTRCVIASVVLFGMLRVLKLPHGVGKGKALHVVIGSAILFGMHWVTYFYALVYSSVAIGMLSLFTYPVMTALLEPLIVRSQFKWSDLILSLLAFTGVYFLVPAFDLDNQVTQGILLGLVSALIYAVRNLLLKLHVNAHSGMTLMFMQVVGVAVLLTPVLFLDMDLSTHASMISTDWMPLLILGVFTTAVGHTLFVKSFKNFSITTVSIFSTLTPLIGIGLGWLFLDELPEGKVLIGGVIIMSAVVIESLRSMRKG